MRKILIVFILLLPLTIFCRDRHKAVKLPISRWREIKRMGLDSTAVPFTDTLFVQFLKKDSFSYHNLGGFIYNGAYTIDEDSILDFGTAKYKIAIKRPTTLILENDAGIFVLGVDASDTAKIIVLPKEEKVLPVTSIDQMIGHWTVYKRTSDKPLAAIDLPNEIKAVYITGPSTDGKQGFVYGGTDGSNNPSWYVKSLGVDQALDCDGKNRRIFKVLKCQSGELILEEEGMKYYFKQFK